MYFIALSIAVCGGALCAAGSMTREPAAIRHHQKIFCPAEDD
jgi:hypothetical protein